MCIPSPATLHFRLEPQRDRHHGLSPTATPSSTTSARPIGRPSRAFYDAGCRYLQFDDTAWAYLCSQAELKKARDRGA